MPVKLEDREYTKEEFQEILRKSEEENADALEKANLVAAMTDAQRAHYAKLEGDAAGEFLYADAPTRTAALAKAAEADSVVYTMKNGTEIRKSDGPLAKQLAEDRDRDSTALAMLTKQADDNRLTKLADSEDYRHLVGTTDERVALIKAAESIEDGDVKETALKSLRAQSKGLAKATTTMGTTTGGTPVDGMTKSQAEGELDKLAKERAAADSIGYLDAYAKVAEENDGLYAAASVATH